MPTSRILLLGDRPQIRSWPDESIGFADNDPGLLFIETESLCGPLRDHDGICRPPRRRVGQRGATGPGSISLLRFLTSVLG